jgi:hypothetical protein
MSSNSQNDIDEEFLDRWLSQQNLPNDIPLKMKLLAFAGHIYLKLDKKKKLRGRPKKEFSDYVRRADIFRSTEQMLRVQGHENLTQTEVINVCIQIAKILHEQGEISDEELSLWTKVSSVKSILDHLPEGFAELDALSRK